LVTPTPQKCVHCRERAVRPTVLSLYTQEMEHDGRKYIVHLMNFQVFQCSNCSEILLDDSATERLTDALREAAGLLAPSEIRRNREALGLTQQQLADSLRISMFTLSRWESGAQIQQRCMDLSLRAFFDVEEFRDYVGASDQQRGASIAIGVSPRPANAPI
jgi:DNA-binding transcriptional regulator YiaG